MLLQRKLSRKRLGNNREFDIHLICSPYSEWNAVSPVNQWRFPIRLVRVEVYAAERRRRRVSQRNAATVNQCRH
jgi:hypothetical protein